MLCVRTYINIALLADRAHNTRIKAASSRVTSMCLFFDQVASWTFSCLVMKLSIEPTKRAIPHRTRVFSFRSSSFFKWGPPKRLLGYFYYVSDCETLF